MTERGAEAITAGPSVVGRRTVRAASDGPAVADDGIDASANRDGRSPDGHAVSTGSDVPTDSDGPTGSGVPTGHAVPTGTGGADSYGVPAGQGDPSGNGGSGNGGSGNGGSGNGGAAGRDQLSAVAGSGGPGAGRDGALARLRSGLPDFTGALLRVARQVLADPAGAARATIVELAERSGTSPATVTRFCRALGFTGYADLRLAIAAESGMGRSAGWTVDIGREIQPTDPLDRVLEQIMAADTRAMRDTAALLDLDEVTRAAQAIAVAGRVDIYGASGSALVGAEMQFSLHRIGVPAWAWTDVHNGLASAALLRPGDVALGVSHSGQTRETIEMLAEAGSVGATTVALTSFPRSPLAELADVVLVTASQATTFRPDALSARHPQLVVLDLLYIAVAQRTHDRAHAAFQRTARAVQGHKTTRRSERSRSQT